MKGDVNLKFAAWLSEALKRDGVFKRGEENIKIYFEKLIYESLKLKIYFSMDEENRFLTMTFDQPISYRYSNDSQRIKSTDALLQKHGDDFFNKHSFFKVTNSNDIENFNRATKNQYKDLIQMFVIVAMDDFIEILSLEEPIIKSEVKI